MVWRQFILVLDDDKDVAADVAMLLREQGLNAHVFTDPIAALEDFKQNSNDCVLVVSDIRMPKMNGFQFVRKARDIKPDQKVVFMTMFEISISEFEKIHPSMKVHGLIKKPVLMRKMYTLIKTSIAATTAIEKHQETESQMLREV